ncbi:thiamine phosphate synthase [Leeuwenhoekiella sp. H156]|uniref:thiamine phosphate synthase n=1 Tax=Leeuwenhoekiella sp. H156 TaxID=3450128 RepID=UPI003FA489E0
MLVVITAEVFFTDEIFQIKQLIDLGLKTVHIRKPKASYSELKSWFQEFEPQYLAAMMLHQHHTLVEEFCCKGMHFKEKQRNVQAHTFKSKVKILKNKGFQVSTSFHEINELKFHAALFDYCFLSPVFKSISKTGYEGKLFEVHDISQKIIALGGITSEKIAKVHQRGFSGVAVLGAIWLSEKPIDAFTKIKRDYENTFK